MKVAFITPSVSRSSGGIFEVELALAKSLTAVGCEVEVYGQNDENTQHDLPRWESIKVYTYPSIGPHAFRYSPALKNAVVKSNCQVGHLQVLWMYTSVVTNHWFSAGKPYVVTIHGMLEPWALQNAGWKKKIVTFLYEGRCLKNANCIHAHTYKEYQDIRKFGLTNPVSIIPNGVDLPDTKPVTQKPAWYAQTNNRKVVLFISRLHPKKGIENMLEAWATLSQHPDWCLVIAGWGDNEYAQSLKNKVRELGLENSIIFTGPLFNQEKHLAFTHADAFILPSLSEGLPMAILEAWSYKVPAVITPACNIPEGYEANAAIKIEPNPTNIAAGLQHLFSLTDDQRQELGQNGYDLVLQKYTWDKIAQQMAQVYEWVANGGQAPATILFD
ncbi:glycosyltransferase [Adhaeribacter rhizoryzae]|uniref:Glycosyltransferase n=1 Tax=Adhaeribacter rhizoryzae TaxID=2607907 RepID=A0A5M6DR90_9BACT|nr:glycosyltransferase [Adhaeribacter rhizoryzae]KAA5548772.1 glycosyltransferase [Adhaeribacter rhizoryzae]